MRPHQGDLHVKDDRQFTILPKLIGGRKMRDLRDLVGIMLFIIMLIGSCGALQYAVCKSEYPDRSLIDCVAP